MTDRLGPYELRGELGRGAMAIVWRGYDPKLDREVAIKEPTVPPGTPPATAIELAERFVREGRTAAALNHPGIVTVFAADSFDGRTAIVMELIEGETLASILERGPLPASAALSVLSQLLDAVAYAHERGVVHRDIKPDNVFLTTDGRVKLADFGIAHTGGTSALTQAGTIMGTPGYMAPEQVTGAPVDARADIFAVGAVAYEMLTGSNPFGATDGAAPTTVLYRIVHEPAPALPPQIDASLPPGLVAILGHAMAKDPAMRFDSAGSFRAALTGDAAPTGGFAPGAAFVSPRAGGSMNWTPYLIVGAVMIVVLGILFAFAGGGGARGGGGAVAATQTTAPEPPRTSPVDTTPHKLTPSGASASSELNDRGTTYPASNVIDGNTSTAWSEGVGGYGESSWVQIDFGQNVHVSEIRVVPGYLKTSKGVNRWWSNGRVKDATIAFSDGSTTAHIFADQEGWQSIAGDPSKETTFVRLTIDSVYPAQLGAHYAEDTNVSEIECLGY